MSPSPPKEMARRVNPGAGLLDPRGTRKYWTSLYSVLNPNDYLHTAGNLPDSLLAPVCHPDAPGFLNRFVHSLQQEALLWALRHLPFPIKAARVLDIGCGTGRWARLFTALGAQVVGVDLAPEAIHAARALVPQGQFYCSDLLEMQFPGQRFDLAISVTVLQHLPYDEQDKAVARIRHYLRDRGYLILLENVRDRGFHVFARPFDEWVRLAEDNGFKIEAVRGYEFVPLLQLEGSVRSAVFALLRPRGPSRECFQPKDWTDVSISVLKNLYRQTVLRAMVAASAPCEAIARTVLPRRLATHGVFVFRLNLGTNK